MARQKRQQKKRRINPGDVLQIHWVTDGELRGWTHTHGMEAFGLPELELLDVPSYFVGAAQLLLSMVADYMLNERPVAAGERMELGPRDVVRFEVPTPLVGQEGYYRDQAVLRVVEERFEASEQNEAAGETVH